LPKLDADDFQTGNEVSDKKKQEKRKKKEEKKRAAFSKRHIIGAFNAGDEEDFGEDPINKNMLAPTIERGIDIEIDVDETEFLDEDKKESSAKLEYVENHPLFKEDAVKQPILPKEVPLSAKTSDAVTAGFPVVNQAPRTEVKPLTDYTRSAEKKGVLNIKDNLDDNFREFFGDTVIIDKETLGEKAQRTRKIKDFVLPETEDDIGVPVFEDDEEREEQNKEQRISEYRSEQDTEAVMSRLMSERAKTTLQMIITTVFALLSAGLSLMAQFNIIPEIISEPTVFFAANAALLIILISINAKQVFFGLGRLISFRANGKSIVSFAMIAALAECGGYLAAGFDKPAGLYGSVAACALMFSLIGSHVNSTRILRAFQTIADTYDKYATTTLDDNRFVHRLTRGLNVNSANVLFKRKTGFTDNFLAHSYSKEKYSKKVCILTSVSIFISIICGIFTYIRTSSIAETMGVICGVAVLCAPFASTLIGTLPAYKMQKNLSKVGAVVPGYSAADEICSANCAVLEGREIFPRSNVMLHGIKTFERERIDKAILYAASVIVQSCDTMAHMFMNVIQNKTDMLYAIDSVEYEPGMGYSYWVDQKRMLLGTRDFMRSHDIDVPSRDYESRYTKTNSRDAMYLSVSGRLYAMFVISYSANPEVLEATRGFVREGINMIIHTRDFNITAQRVAKYYRIPETMITVVREDDIEELSRYTEFSRHAPSSLTHMGSLISYVKGIVACYNLRSAAKTSSAVALIGVILGMMLGVGLSLVGSMFSIGVLSVLLFQTIWCVILYIIVSVHKY
jgi:hypothetical protein